MTPPQLAERLGYGPEGRLLIVNCDDLGSSHSANIATLRSVVHGIATSATLMVPCPWAREAARMFEGRCVGVHLTLTSDTAPRSTTTRASSRPRPGARSSGWTRPTRAPNAGRSSRPRSPGASTSPIWTRT
jgi:predicted glycoside hydrolase/deacetylase ChbG (UPF0249 family)